MYALIPLRRIDACNQELEYQRGRRFMIFLGLRQTFKKQSISSFVHLGTSASHFKVQPPCGHCLFRSLTSRRSGFHLLFRKQSTAIPSGSAVGWALRTDWSPRLQRFLPSTIPFETIPFRSLTRFFPTAWSDPHSCRFPIRQLLRVVERKVRIIRRWTVKFEGGIVAQAERFDHINSDLDKPKTVATESNFLAHREPKFCFVLQLRRVYIKSTQ